MTRIDRASKRASLHDRRRAGLPTLYPLACIGKVPERACYWRHNDWFRRYQVDPNGGRTMVFMAWPMMKGAKSVACGRPACAECSPASCDCAECAARRHGEDEECGALLGPAPPVGGVWHRCHLPAGHDDGAHL